MTQVADKPEGPEGEGPAWVAGCGKEVWWVEKGKVKRGPLPPQKWRRVLTLSPDNQSARDNIAKLEAVKSGGQAE